MPELYLTMGLVYVNTQDAIRRVRSAFKELSMDQVNKSIARAINATLGLTATRINREIRSRYNLSASAVSDRMFVVRAKYSNPTGKILLSVATIPMKEFNPTQREGEVITRRVGGKKGGLASTKAGVKKGEPRYALSVEILRGEKKAIPSAYFKISAGLKDRVVARGQYNGGFSFDQTMKERSLKAPSVYSIVIGGRIHKDIVLFMNYRFLYDMQREFKQRVAEMAAKSAI